MRELLSLIPLAFVACVQPVTYRRCETCRKRWREGSPDCPQSDLHRPASEPVRL